MQNKIDEEDDSSSSGSDYNVDSYIRPTRVRKLVNDESADLLGNFDDEKRKQILDGTFNESTSQPNPSDNEDEECVLDGCSDKAQTLEAVQQKYGKIEDDEDEQSVETEESLDDHDGLEDDSKRKEVNINLTKDQISSLLRGASKANRHVLYVTNLNFETTKEDLCEYFARAGQVKSVRIPKKRQGGFAFVEMTDLDGFQRGLELHNTELHSRKIKVQLSEAGKKKSANKKNIIKQKNRKLAEMRNESKAFTKSGKFYDKTLKKEKAKEMLAQKRWRKKPNVSRANALR